MVTGEKRKEFRDKTKYWESRLLTKDGEKRQFDRVRFVNGYGATRPRFSVSFKGLELEPNGVHATYSNGLEVDTTGTPTYVILLGEDIRVEQG